MAAPLGNNFAIGNNGGRPPIYEKPEDLVTIIEEYFEFVKGEYKEEEVVIVVKGKEVKNKVTVCIRPYESVTITGLALYIGFCGRKTLHDYANKEEFGYIIKRAMSRVEKEYEHNLQSNSPAGSIFALKNMGWRDKVETGITDSEGNDVPFEKPYSKSDLEEILKKANG